MDGIFVTNKNAETHYDRYDGEDFVFPPGERVFIPKAAATHCFGWNLPDKSETLVRLGWAMVFNPADNTFVENEHGIRKLANFVFDEAVMVPKISILDRVDRTEIA